ncbi:MAG: hypothetical protein HY299_07250 [Verrucomicrobia bacterium]|nr:hypothetical protein [Verrucomicrobiota bacterium]
MTQIEQARATIFAESRGTLEGHERLLGLALNEAEALAWETGFPHLVFPTLALEKVQGVAAWASHQRSVRRPNSALLRAA